MGPEIRPLDILQKRLEVIRALLGSGWLGMPWCDWHSNRITSTDMSLRGSSVSRRTDLRSGRVVADNRPGRFSMWSRLRR